MSIYQGALEGAAHDTTGSTAWQALRPIFTALRMEQYDARDGREHNNAKRYLPEH